MKFTVKRWVKCHCLCARICTPLFLCWYHQMETIAHIPHYRLRTVKIAAHNARSGDFSVINQPISFIMRKPTQTDFNLVSSTLRTVQHYANLNFCRRDAFFSVRDTSMVYLGHLDPTQVLVTQRVKDTIFMSRGPLLFQGQKKQ